MSLERNVTLRQGKRHFFVSVGGIPMGYVTNVEIVRPTVQRIYEDGRTEITPAGNPVVRIEVPLRYVTMEPADGTPT